MITLTQAFENWENEIKPLVVARYGENDIPAMSESWNDHTDALCRDGELCSLQYHYSPAFDEPMPENDIDYILEQMGISFDYEWHSERNDGLMIDMPEGSNHYLCTLERGENSFQVWYSMGPALYREPELRDVLFALVSDNAYLDDTFEEWADNLGYDIDSRKAEKIFNACKETKEKLESMFSLTELDELSDLFQDY